MKPQLKFKDKVDNSSTPWVPILREKPNAVKPLPVMILFFFFFWSLVLLDMWRAKSLLFVPATHPFTYLPTTGLQPPAGASNLTGAVC